MYSSAQVFKRVFEGHIEDTISDEQMLRILEPVLKRISEGAYDRPRRIFKKSKFSIKLYMPLSRGERMTACTVKILKKRT